MNSIVTFINTNKAIFGIDTDVDASATKKGSEVLTALKAKTVTNPFKDAADDITKSIDAFAEVLNVTSDEFKKALKDGKFAADFSNKDYQNKPVNDALKLKLAESKFLQNFVNKVVVGKSAADIEKDAGFKKFITDNTLCQTDTAKCTTNTAKAFELLAAANMCGKVTSGTAIDIKTCSGNVIDTMEVGNLVDVATNLHEAGIHSEATYDIPEIA